LLFQKEFELNLIYYKKSKVRKHHLDGYEAALQIPQVFPFNSLMYPVSPHEVPHEFLILQYWSLAPTNKTP